MTTFWQQNKLILTILGGTTLLAMVAYFAWNGQVTVAVLNATLRASIPLILGGLCGLLCERSGVVNIGIEGQMLLAAFVAHLVNAFSGSLELALVVGIAAGAVMGLFHAFMAVTLKMDQIIAGTVLNILSTGLTGYFYIAGLSTEGKYLAVSIPGLSQIPLVGEVLFKNPPLTYLALMLVVVVHYALFYTRWGLRTRAVGEHPKAADTVGINVYRMRYLNVILGGCLAGLAGAFLTLEAVGSFERGMTNGRGFIALAVLIFGKWTPFGVFGAALLFGFFTALQTQLQFFGQIDIPHQFIGLLPYVLTIFVLAGFVGRSRPPAAVGQPYEK